LFKTNAKLFFTAYQNRLLIVITTLLSGIGADGGIAHRNTSSDVKTPLYKEAHPALFIGT